MNKQRIDAWIGAALSLIALVAYILTLSPDAYPGESANLVVQNAGLFPRLTPDHPLWGALAWLVSRIPIGALALKLNLLSALCGAACIGLVYVLIHGGIYAAIQVDASNRSRAEVAARLGGISAALCLAFCIPFWMVSNRAHHASFDVFLLLVATACFYGYAGSGRRGLAYLFAFVYGVGIVEFATFIVLAPLFGGALLFFLWRREDLAVKTAIKLIVSALAGLSLYFIDAWWFYHSPGYDLRGYEGYFQILWLMWRDQSLLIGHSLPQSGWLIIAVTTIIPWLTSLAIAHRALNQEKDWSYYILHVVMTVLTLGVLFNMKFAPWRMLGWGQLLVTPYVLAGMVFGYLVAYWYLLPSTWGDESENPNWKRISRALGTLFALSLIGGLAVTPFVNFRFADGRGSSFLSTYAREVIKSMSGRTWLVTDGAFDAQLMIAANDLHCRVRVLNANAGSQDVYMKYVADQFDSPRLKNLARIGMFPLLQEWLKTTPEAISDVAVLSTPDIWVGSGFSALPNRLVFLGAKNLQETDPEKVFLEHERFWKEAAPVILSKASRAALLEYSKQRVVRHMGLVANNLGVFMEDMQRKDEAFKAYSKAREIDAGNISALLNQITMIENGYPTSSAETIKGELKKILAGRNARLSIWSLSLDYGYVRSPQAFVQLGWVWALSGQPGLAVSGLKRAMDLLPENKKSMLKQTLAGIRLSQDEDEESETLYKELLMENPENVTALVGLTRIASKKGDQQHAQELLLKAKQAGLSEERLALEQASLYVRAGDLKQARSLLQERVGSKPRSDAVGTMLLGILIRQNDERTLQEYLDKMEAVEGKDGAFVLALARGHLAVKQNDWNAARSHFEQAIARNPDNVYILESLLRLDVMLMKADQADADVKKLLRADPDNAFGNYILGTLQLKDKNYGLAEDAFRKSLQKNKTPLVLNDLAWLLQERGSYEEAEKLARAAIDAYDKTFQPWDTLGVILMRTRRLDEAEQAFQKALSFFDGDFNLFLHMAELYVMKKNKGRASELIQTITDKKIRLSLEDQSKLEGIRRLAEEL